MKTFLLLAFALIAAVTMAGAPIKGNDALGGFIKYGGNNFNGIGRQAVWAVYGPLALLVCNFVEGPWGVFNGI